KGNANNIVLRKTNIMERSLPSHLLGNVLGIQEWSGTYVYISVGEYECLQACFGVYVCVYDHSMCVCLCLCVCMITVCVCVCVWLCERVCMWLCERVCLECMCVLTVCVWCCVCGWRLAGGCVV